MGITNFLKQLSECGIDEDICIEEQRFHGYTVGVDALGWLHRGLTSAVDGLHAGNRDERRHIDIE